MKEKEVRGSVRAMSYDLFFIENRATKKEQGTNGGVESVASVVEHLSERSSHAGSSSLFSVNIKEDALRISSRVRCLAFEAAAAVTSERERGKDAPVDCVHALIREQSNSPAVSEGVKGKRMSVKVSLETVGLELLFWCARQRG